MRDGPLVSHITTTKEDCPLLDPEAEKVIRQVATRLARPYWWAEYDELVSEAYIACLETDVLTEATSHGAFHERIKGKVIDSQRTERRWREEWTVPIELADVGDDGTVFTHDEQGEPVAYVAGDRAWRGTEDEEAVAGREWQPKTGRGEDNLPRHEIGGRSRLLDNLAARSGDDFVEWAEDRLNDDSRWSGATKAKHLDALLQGSRSEMAGVWGTYVSAKRVGGSKTADGREVRAEEWQARYRWHGDPRSRRIRAHPLVTSPCGDTVEVGAVLRTRNR